MESLRQCRIQKHIFPLNVTNYYSVVSSAEASNYSTLKFKICFSLIHFPKHTKFWLDRSGVTRLKVSLAFRRTCANRHRARSAGTFLFFHLGEYIYMLFTGREVRIGKNCARAVLKTEGTVFPYTDRPRPVNNVFIFFCNSGGGTTRIGLRIVCKQSFYVR